MTTYHLQDLKEHLEQCLPSLQGDWVSKKSKYESSCASAIGATLQDGRYRDCIWKGIHLELKKSGQASYWVDLVKYSEYLLKRTQKSQPEIITLFLCYRNQQIRGICAVTTENLIKTLNLKPESANDLLRIKGEVPHDLQAHVDITGGAIRKIAEFCVGNFSIQQKDVDLTDVPEL